MSKELIYAVEDEAHIQQLIKYNLEANGYRVVTFESGESLINELKNTSPDMFVLDIMLLGMDGLEVCRFIRQDVRFKNLPIIMLTAKGEEFDKVLGLELGADDYITKPFSVRELVARIKALFRRMGSTISTDQDIIKSGEITIDISRREVFKNGELVEMTLKEFELLKLLVLSKGKVLSRELLLEKIWGFDYYGETRTVDVHVRYLRQKIEDDDSNPIYIETVRGIGYRFNDRNNK